jgi:hypothetical protein
LFSGLAYPVEMALDAEFLAPFAAAAACALVTRAAARAWLGPVETPRGWAVIRPGGMHWGGLLGAGAIIGMLSYVGLFIGSSRADAAFQMQMLWLIVTGFAVCSIGCLWQMKQVHRTAARYRGSQVSFRRAVDGERITRNLADIAAMQRPRGGRIRMIFKDGEELRLDPYAEKVPDLWDRVIAVNDGNQ